jgi:hypothetical protein
VEAEIFHIEKKYHHLFGLSLLYIGSEKESGDCPEITSASLPSISLRIKRLSQERLISIETLKMPT